MLSKIQIIGIASLLLITTAACTSLPTSRQPQPQGQKPATNQAPANQAPVNQVSTAKRLDLSNQGLDKIPSYVFDRTDLEQLDVSGNRLTGAIQAEIRKLKNLKVLDASNNQMTGVPAEIGQLSNLQVLDLSNNQLTGLPYELGNLKNLQLLDLSGNDYSKQDLDIIRQKLTNIEIIVD